MIENPHPKLSIRKQAKMLGVNRNRLKPSQPKTTKEDLEIMKALDIIYTECPFYGQRKLRLELRDLGYRIGRNRIRRLMKIMGIEALVPKPYTNKPNKENHIYPYLLRNRAIKEVDEVWCADITYIPMQKGHAYLVAIMDWHSRAVLGWEVSNTMDTGFCVLALKQAMASTGRKPKIFNTDQGSQFSSEQWTSKLKTQGINLTFFGTALLATNGTLSDRDGNSLRDLFATYRLIQRFSSFHFGHPRGHLVSQVGFPVGPIRSLWSTPPCRYRSTPWF